MPKALLFSLVFGLILIASLAFRLPHLSDRPLHNDEAVNADKFRETYERGTLRYDPTQYHGPALWFATLPLAWLSGHHRWVELTETNYRLVSVTCGVGVILSLLLLRDAIGLSDAIWAGLFIAVSPAMVYYSRDYIHEMLLVLCTSLAMGCAWRWSQSGRLLWAVLVGLFTGLMLATKETTLVIVAAMFVAIFLAAVWGKYGEMEKWTLRPWFHTWHITVAMVTLAVVTLLFYSSFLRDLAGLKIAAQFVNTYASRANGQIGHVQPPGYYFWLLVYQKLSPAPRPWFSEGLIVGLALIGATVVLFFRVASTSPGTSAKGESREQREPNALQGSPGQTPSPALSRSTRGGGGMPFQRFLVFYTFTLFCAFSLISYKTPWNVLNPLYGMCLLAGIGASAMVRACRLIAVRTILTLLILAGIAQLGWLAHQATTLYAADIRNPYVYGQTSLDALKLIDLANTLGRLSSQGYQTPILVGTTESAWPLPWYLRSFSHVGFYESAPPWIENLNPGLVIATSDLIENLDAHYLDSKRYTQANSRGLRPGIVLSVYIRNDLWNALMAERSKKRAT